MVTVYVIESISDATWYTGMALNAENRLKEHNAGKNRFTKGHIPWRIVYTEDHADWASGRLREKYLKNSSWKKLVSQETARWWWCGFPACVTQSGRESRTGYQDHNNLCQKQRLFFCWLY